MRMHSARRRMYDEAPSTRGNKLFELPVGSMRAFQIILTQLVFLTGCQPWWGHQSAPAAPPMNSPYPMTATPQPVFVPGGQPYIQPGPVIVPTGPVVMPSYGQPGFVSPPAVVGAPSFAAPGAQPGTPIMPGQPGVPNAAPVVVPPMESASLGPNPIAVPVPNEEVAWDQIADVVSIYFRIAREDRARLATGTEGRIETAPLDGATWLEPFRKDSVGTFNRWESTFQSIRRRAIVRVIPDRAGYLVEVIVEKELEDLPAPERATAGAATFRDTGSLPSRRLEESARLRSSPRWLALGRDPLLEQRMLADIQARFGGVATAPVPIVR